MSKDVVNAKALREIKRYLENLTEELQELLKTKTLPFAQQDSDPQTMTNKESRPQKHRSILALFLHFPVCIYFWPIFIDFPAHQHFTALPANEGWENSWKRGTWRKLATDR